MIYDISGYTFDTWYIMILFDIGWNKIPFWCTIYPDIVDTLKNTSIFYTSCLERLSFDNSLTIKSVADPPYNYGVHSNSFRWKLYDLYKVKILFRYIKKMSNPPSAVSCVYFFFQILNLVIENSGSSMNGEIHKHTYHQ